MVMVGSVELLVDELYVIYDNFWQLDQWHDNTHCIQVTIVDESE